MFGGLLIILSSAAMATSNLGKFHRKGTDLSKITWAHAVNNKTHLEQALNSNVNMLEADISLGKLSESDTDDIPIMAHPPATISDLSLQDFLITVNNHNANQSKLHKGIKLDFKSIEAFTASTDVIKENIKDTRPLWLNADIISGPVNSTGTPVDADTFITTSNKEFENVTLSLGWTTAYNSSYEGEGYTEDQINEMLHALSTFQNNHPITFAVRAGLVAESRNEMKTLINNVTDSTLTIWSSEDDPVNVKKLKLLIFEIGLDKVYVDVPKKLKDDLGLSPGNQIMPSGVLGILVLSTIL